MSYWVILPFSSSLVFLAARDVIYGEHISFTTTHEVFLHCHSIHGHWIWNMREYGTSMLFPLASVYGTAGHKLAYSFFGTTNILCFHKLLFMEKFITDCVKKKTNLLFKILILNLSPTSFSNWYLALVCEL